MGSILLATDGSEYASAAAEAAIDRAADRDVPLYVICVIDRQKFDDPALSSAELATIYAEDHATISVEAVAEMAAEAGVSVEGVTRHGVPHETILEYADTVGAEEIVVGEHGDHDDHFSGVGRQLIRDGDVPVTVVEATA